MSEKLTGSHAGCKGVDGVHYPRVVVELVEVEREN
jgi:hypothetical protein